MPNTQEDTRIVDYHLRALTAQYAITLFNAILDSKRGEKHIESLAAIGLRLMHEEYNFANRLFETALAKEEAAEESSYEEEGSDE